MTAIRGLGRRWYKAILAWVLPGAAQNAFELEARVINLINMALLAALLVPSFMIEYFVAGAGPLVVGLGVAGIFMVGAPVIYKLSGSFVLSRELFIASLFCYKVWEMSFFGGVVSPGVVWLSTLPVAALLLGSVVSAAVWLAVATGSVVSVQLLFGANVIFTRTTLPYPQMMYVFSLIGLFVAFVSFMLMFENARKDAFRKLELANRTIHELATRDPLTGVYNRRHMWSVIGSEEAQALRSGRGFCICLFDLDHFKHINDTYGHAAGDSVLQCVAQTVDREVRLSACFGRYGGEEFILLLKDARLEHARQACERIAKLVEALRFPDVSPTAGVTVSGGVVEYRPGEGFAQTIMRADTALYAAKAAGRNCVVADDAERFGAPRVQPAGAEATRARAF